MFQMGEETDRYTLDIRTEPQSTRANSHRESLAQIRTQAAPLILGFDTMK